MILLFWKNKKPKNPTLNIYQRPKGQMAFLLRELTRLRFRNLIAAWRGLQKKNSLKRAKGGKQLLLAKI